MRIGLLAIVSGIALSISAAAIAAEVQTGASSQSASATNDSQKMVCHFISHEGTLLPKPQCATQYAWDKERRRQERELAEYQLRNNSVPFR